MFGCIFMLHVDELISVTANIYAHLPLCRILIIKQGFGCDCWWTTFTHACHRVPFHCNDTVHFPLSLCYFLHFSSIPWSLIQFHVFWKSFLPVQLFLNAAPDSPHVFITPPALTPHLWFSPFSPQLLPLYSLSQFKETLHSTVFASRCPPPSTFLQFFFSPWLWGRRCSPTHTQDKRVFNHTVYLTHILHCTLSPSQLWTEGKDTAITQHHKQDPPHTPAQILCSM